MKAAISSRNVVTLGLSKPTFYWKTNPSTSGVRPVRSADQWEHNQPVHISTMWGIAPYRATRREQYTFPVIWRRFVLLQEIMSFLECVYTAVFYCRTYISIVSALLS